MITAIAIDTNLVELRISGSPDDFQKDLLLVKNAVSQDDRTWLPDRKSWRIKQADKYTHIRPIATALMDFALQLPLFGS